MQQKNVFFHTVALHFRLRLRAVSQYPSVSHRQHREYLP